MPLPWKGRCGQICLCGVCRAAKRSMRLRRGQTRQRSPPCGGGDCKDGVLAWRIWRDYRQSTIARNCLHRHLTTTIWTVCLPSQRPKAFSNTINPTAVAVARREILSTVRRQQPRTLSLRKRHSSSCPVATKRRIASRYSHSLSSFHHLRQNAKDSGPCLRTMRLPLHVFPPVHFLCAACSHRNRLRKQSCSAATQKQVLPVRSNKALAFRHQCHRQHEPLHLLYNQQSLLCPSPRRTSISYANLLSVLGQTPPSTLRHCIPRRA